MRYLLCSFFILTFLSACTITQESYYTPGEVMSVSLSKEQKVGGGVLIKDHMILTSAHVVRERGSAFVFVSLGGQRIPLSKIIRDQKYDMAYIPLSDVGVVEVWKEELKRKRAYLQTGGTLSVDIVFSGKLMSKSGIILSLEKDIIGVSEDGYIQTLSGILMTDIDFVPGESGSPIYDEKRNLIDVVHVR